MNRCNIITTHTFSLETCCSHHIPYLINYHTAWVPPKDSPTDKKIVRLYQTKKIGQFFHRFFFKLSMSFVGENWWKPTDLGATPTDIMHKLYLHEKNIKFMYFDAEKKVRSCWVLGHVEVENNTTYISYDYLKRTLYGINLFSTLFFILRGLDILKSIKTYLDVKKY